MLLAGRVRGDEEDLRPPDEASALGHVRPGVNPVQSQLSIQYNSSQSHLSITYSWSPRP